MLGKIFLHYRILDKPGLGGVGEVYRSEDTNLHRQGAVNALSDAFTGDEVGEVAISVAPELVER